MATLTRTELSTTYTFTREDLIAWIAAGLEAEGLTDVLPVGGEIDDLVTLTLPADKLEVDPSAETTEDITLVVLDVTEGA